MARAGILYSQVAKAATQLAEQGKNPTVDTVRDALGGTGSKSTIAPMLKRWKAEHQDNVVSTEAGIPAQLLTAIKNVYEGVQAHAQAQIDAERAAHDAAIQSAAAREQQLKATHQTLQQVSNAQEHELNRLRDELSQLRVEHQSLTSKHAGAVSENAGMQLRLADRGTEITALNAQLTQAAKQFAHFQEATAEQRAEERRIAEQRIARLEQEGQATQSRLAEQQQHGARQAAQISSLTQEAEQLRETLREAREQAVAANAERDQLAFQMKAQASAQDELKKELGNINQALREARVGLAGQEKETSMLTIRLVAEEKRNAKLDADRLALTREAATLRAELENAKLGNSSRAANAAATSSIEST